MNEIERLRRECLEKQSAPEMRQANINALLDDFDFACVHRVMVFLNWKWGMGDDAAIPSEGDLRRSARKLLEEVAENGGLTGSGGFGVRRDEWGGLRLWWAVCEFRAIDGDLD